jgi:hypothetical protein
MGVGGQGQARASLPPEGDTVPIVQETKDTKLNITPSKTEILENISFSTKLKNKL